MVAGSNNLGGHCEITNSQFGGKVVCDQQETGVPQMEKLCEFLHVLQTHLLYQYVLNLAKYDQNYDIRDRARFLRQLVVPDEVIS